MGINFSLIFWWRCNMNTFSFALRFLSNFPNHPRKTKRMQYSANKRCTVRKCQISRLNHECKSQNMSNRKQKHHCKTCTSQTRLEIPDRADSPFFSFKLGGDSRPQPVRAGGMAIYEEMEILVLFMCSGGWVGEQKQRKERSGQKDPPTHHSAETSGV